MARLPADIQAEFRAAVAAGEKPGALYRRLQLEERGITWHQFYHPYRRFKLSARGETAQRRPGPMQAWAAALATAIVNRLVAVYPPVFVAEVVAAARRSLIERPRSAGAEGNAR